MVTLAEEQIPEGLLGLCDHDHKSSCDPSRITHEQSVRLDLDNEPVWGSHKSQASRNRTDSFHRVSGDRDSWLCCAEGGNSARHGNDQRLSSAGDLRSRGGDSAVAGQYFTRSAGERIFPVLRSQCVVWLSADSTRRSTGATCAIPTGADAGFSDCLRDPDCSIALSARERQQHDAAPITRSQTITNGDSRSDDCGLRSLRGQPRRLTHMAVFFD